MTTESPLSVFDAINRRRAVRSFTPEKLDEKTVRRLLDAAVQAPTAIHLEPWAFVIIQDPPLLRRISDRAKAVWPAERPQRPLHHQAAVPAASTFAQLLGSPDFNIFYDASTLIAIGAIGEGTFFQADCWLAAENLMLAACALGLGSCCIGSAVPALNSPETRRELDLPSGLAIIAPIIVGVPKEVPGATSRKPPQIVCWRKERPASP
jgi:nitroreductase